MNNKTSTCSEEKVSLQSWLRPELTLVNPNRDYHLFRDQLNQISTALTRSWLEELAIDYALAKLPPDADLSTRSRAAEFAIFALRAELLRHLLGLPSFRSFSRQLASSDLLANFCGILTLEGIKWSSKSTLERASKLFTPEEMASLNRHLCEIVGNADYCHQVDLKEEVDLSVCLMDSTCFEANIHFPVDWLLLKDVSIHLLKALTLIRREGLVCRMPFSPQQWISRVNSLSMEMTQVRRRKDAKRARKRILRSLKKQLKLIAAHARRHRDKLRQQDLTVLRWSEHQINLLVRRIDEKLAQIPEIIRQAHERIIGERQVPSKEKILSAHEPDLQVVSRGKAGREVEFGNQLFISESSGGFICDYKLYKHAAPAESKKLIDSLKRQQAYDIDQPIGEVITDRGFDSKAVAKALEESSITSSVCPKNPHTLTQRLCDPHFVKSQKRRASTEARIAILTNNGGRVCRAKGFKHRHLAIGWGVLSHNFLWIARKVRKQRDKAMPQAA